MDSLISSRDRLIVALDVPGPNQALSLVDQLKSHVGYFKVGLQLFCGNGPSIVTRILDRGGRVFLDLKLHDIPNTVSKAIQEIAQLGVHMLTLHAQGGPDMLRKARETVLEKSERSGLPPPLLLGVTVLTSLDQAGIEHIGYQRPLDDLVVRLARLSKDSGLDGIVCSPHELELLKKSGVGEELSLVTPGIRPENAPADDQRRTLPASRAIEQGASYLVVGRPITTAPDPASAARFILDEIDRARITR
ncbi:MAG TPA: orotidine-5'-phosphate decarboxylase [Acidobacteriota bacterium]|nr:orotidine-5'-phosphate decarboxylase [Acidobacteriota bacterium]